MLEKSDPTVYEIVKREEERQQNVLSLIPSENFFSPAVREAVGSVFSHKYAEGNVGQRYYEGNEVVDELESLAIARARQAFSVPEDWSANVQALSGSSANLAVYLALLQPGDTMMAMYLPDGGHLSHGWSFEPNTKKRAAGVDDAVYTGGSRKVNITSKMFNVVQYKTNPETRLLDYDAIARSAKKYKPQLLITGGTAYPRNIDYSRMREIADSVGAFYMADIAHEAGLISAGVIPSPVGIADVVTMTTHKTLRAGRGAIILAHEDTIKKINKALLPGLQGGPHNHNIAGICVGLGEALTPEFKQYARQVVANAQALAAALLKAGFDVVSGGADKHLILIDLHNQPLLGKKAARALAVAGIVGNANSVPQETRGPANPSGLRLGTPWVTTRGMKEPQMSQIAAWIAEVVAIAGQWKDLEFTAFTEQLHQSAEIQRISQEVAHLCAQFPLEIEERAEVTVRK
nr:Serine hydroxymethyltransferase [uncultured bacterium]